MHRSAPHRSVRRLQLSSLAVLRSHRSCFFPLSTLTSAGRGIRCDRTEEPSLRVRRVNCEMRNISSLFIQRRTQYRMGRYRGPTGVKPRSAPPSHHRRAQEEAEKAEVSAAEDGVKQFLDTMQHSTGASQNSEEGRTAKMAASSNNSNNNNNSRSDGAGPSPVSGDAVQEPAMPLYHVQIADRYGMPVTISSSAPSTFAELEALCPQPLRESIEETRRKKHWRELTSVQQAAIPLALEHRDLLCIAPTATGKTLAYALPSLMRILIEKGKMADGSNDLSRNNIERLIRDKVARGEICRYCELSIADHKVCPMTGALHPPISADEEKTRRALRVDELSSITEPQILILVPTAQLASQVYRLFRALTNEVKIGHLQRASTMDEQRHFLKALEGSEVLISAPETLLPAMYKRKLSLQRVSVIVMDEVDALLSVDHFEPVKIILGALSKKARRPQRLLFGATLPPSVYTMIKEQLLLPSHRFVLADYTKDSRGHPVVFGNPAAPPPQKQTSDNDTVENALQSTESAAQNGPNALSHSSPNAHGIATVNVSLTHVVFPISRAGKVSKLIELYNTGKLRTDQRTLIFCQTRHNVQYVSSKLQEAIPEMRVISLTSRSSVTNRSSAMRMFESGVSMCLVSTDILSRGIDFHNVVYVVNYDMPFDMETWLHRCGRCGRHGMRGYCYTFFQPVDVQLAKPLVAHLRQTRQIVPYKLQEYAKQSFIDVFTSSLHHHPTRPVTHSALEEQRPVLGRAKPRYPDYTQQNTSKHFRPQ